MEKTIKIDIDALMDVLIPYEGKVKEIQIFEDTVQLVKVDGTNDMVSLKMLQKKEEDEEAKIKSELRKQHKPFVQPKRKAKYSECGPRCKICGVITLKDKKHSCCF